MTCYAVEEEKIPHDRRGGDWQNGAKDRHPPFDQVQPAVDTGVLQVVMQTRQVGGEDAIEGNGIEVNLLHVHQQKCRKVMWNHTVHSLKYM